jgi:hypothetical protein
MNKLLQNAMMTPDGVILNSCNQHDYREHNGYFVDGGLEYARYGCPTDCKDKFEPLFLYDNDDFLTIKEKLVWGTFGKDGKQQLKWVKFIDCEDDHLKAILNIKISDLYKDVINTILEERKITLRIKKIKKLKNGI